MADNIILAIHTYGSQRVKHPITKKPISAYKIGYSSAACETLLKLYGPRARDVSSSHASYRYVQIDGETTVRHGYLLLTVSAEALAQAEMVTRRYHRAAVYRWRDKQWWELPNNSTNDYLQPTTHSGPNFDPSGYRPVSPSTGEKEAALEGIHVEKSQRDPTQTPWWWLVGDTYPQREILKRYGARFSTKRRCWYYVGWELPEGIQRLVTESPIEKDAPCSDAEAEAILGVRLAPHPSDIILPSESDENVSPATDEDYQPSDATPDNSTVDVPVEPPHIRVYKPHSLPTDGTPLDEVQIAIVQAKTQPTPVIQADTIRQKRNLVQIGQACVGELTGSISGNVWCYGYAIHEGSCIYVNLGGPRMAVEAIRAKFSKGEIVNCIPWDAPAIELTAGEGNTGMYHDFMQNIPEAKFTSLILCHDWLVNPNYSGKSTTFILRTDESQAAIKLKQHITELVNVPVFDEWAGYLYHAGQAAMLVRPTRSAGNIDLLSIDLDIDAWTRLVTSGLSTGTLNLRDRGV